MPQPQPVTDPEILAQFNEGSTDPHWAKPVTDPAILSEFEGKPKVSKKKDSAVDSLKGIGEFALSVGTGLGADALGGLSGIGTYATNAMGLTHDDPAENVKNFQDKLTYQPKTESGKALQGLAGEIGKPIAKLKEKLGDWAQEDSNSPIISTVYSMMPDVLLTIAGAKLPPAAAEAATRGAAQIAQKAASAEVRNQSIRQTTRAGLKLPPSEYGGLAGRTIQGVSGKSNVDREFSRDNQAGVDRLARLDMDLHPEAPLDPATFAADRRMKAAPYEKARQLPRMQTDQEFLTDLTNSGKRYQSIARDIPDAVVPDIDKERGRYLVDSLEPGSALDMMSILRDDASAMYRSGKPEDRAVASVKRDISAAFEGLLARHAAKNGHPEWTAEFQEARKAIAKSHMYEDATNSATGHVSARHIVGQRETGTKMDGEATIIADAAAAFPKVFQDVDKQGQYGPFSVIDLFIALGGGASAAMLHDPAALAMGAGAAARPAARSMLRSTPYQRAFAKPPKHSQGALSKSAQAVGDTLGAKATGAAAGAELGRDSDSQ